MTLSRFVLRNVTRNKRRTAFTVLSIGFSLFLLLALYTFLDLLYDPPVSQESLLRLAVQRSTSLADSMPLAYQKKLERVPHVRMVMPFQWFGGIYQDPKNFFANLAGDPDKMWNMFPELEVTEATRKAFAHDRRAAVAGVDLMERFGWKVGDTIVLQGTIYPVDLELNIVGTYAYELGSVGLYFRFDYLNEALGDPGTVGTFWLQADRAASIPEIVDTVDTMFRNTPAETKTQTEKAFGLEFVAMLGNVRLMIGSIAGVVVFTMLLVSGGTMAMTIRERMREVAILKAIGYTRVSILKIVLGESIVIALLGYVIALGLIYSVNSIDLYQATQGFLTVLAPTAQVYAGVAGVSLLIGFVSGLMPGLSASSMSIARAIRQLE